MTLDKGIQLMWNATVGLVFLGVIGVTMVANYLVDKDT